MRLTNAREENRVPKAVGYMNTFPGMTVPDAMKLANFTSDKQKFPAKQMWIRCRLKKETVVLITTPTTSVCVDYAVGDSGKGISSVLSMSEIASPPTKVKRTRWPAAATQACCTEAIEKNESTQQRSSMLLLSMQERRPRGKMACRQGVLLNLCQCNIKSASVLKAF
jgi:hypothetical protein